MEWGKGTPKEREVDRRREVWEFEGWVCEREAIGAPSMLRLIRNASTRNVPPSCDSHHVPPRRSCMYKCDSRIFWCWAVNRTLLTCGGSGTGVFASETTHPPAPLHSPQRSSSPSWSLPSNDRLVRLGGWVTVNRDPDFLLKTKNCTQSEWSLNSSLYCFDASVRSHAVVA